MWGGGWTTADQTQGAERYADAMLRLTRQRRPERDIRRIHVPQRGPPSTGFLKWREAGGLKTAGHCFYVSFPEIMLRKDCDLHLFVGVYPWTQSLCTVGICLSLFRWIASLLEDRLYTDDFTPRNYTPWGAAP